MGKKLQEVRYPSLLFRFVDSKFKCIGKYIYIKVIQEANLVKAKLGIYGWIVMRNKIIFYYILKILMNLLIKPKSLN